MKKGEEKWEASSLQNLKVLSCTNSLVPRVLKLLKLQPRSQDFSLFIFPLQIKKKRKSPGNEVGSAAALKEEERDTNDDPLSLLFSAPATSLDPESSGF